ncbi:hypothetical protein ACKKBG_A19330 [Auxenochlorella protothecoides x Auxenochlorella symbiontica]
MVLGKPHESHERDHEGYLHATPRPRWRPPRHTQWEIGTQRDDTGLGVVQMLDQYILHATLTEHPDKQEDIVQVVLLGDAMDTRPFRLDWPSGIVFYLVAPTEAHSVAASALAAAAAQAPRGCLLRRVRTDGPLALDAALVAAGFRGDRLSAWLLQRPGCGAGSLPGLLEGAGELAAHGSLVLGEVPPDWSARHALDQLAVAGLLGATRAAPGGAGVVFHATQQRLSAQQAQLFRDHVGAAEAADEDFFGNFS